MANKQTLVQHIKAQVTGETNRFQSALNPTCPAKYHSTNPTVNTEVV